MVPRDTTEDESTIELRNTSDRVLITAELPDRSLDDVRVSVSGTTIRIQAAPRDASPQANGLDRTISLPETVTAADVVTVYNEPTLTVIVSIEN